MSKYKNLKKNTKSRNNEYYNTQEMLDNINQQARNGINFYSLMEMITSEQNIDLAYRNLKTNSGSKTAGTDNRTIKYLSRLTKEEMVNIVKNKLNHYQPQKVRRVMIPKANGKLRPLGIPTITDRLIQQCFKQILEPICEAKFYKHSYGFRQLRSTSHAIARAEFLINHTDYHYVVDVDIEGFFDNINHKKLLRQLWTIGIRDKKALAIIKQMLRAEIQGIGIPTKGTPQGGILSPLLSNVVLNELDQWIASQWEYLPTKYDYFDSRTRNRALRKTNIKEMSIVRYADDFKIFCRNYNTAQKIMSATIC